jgi:hypothetical protein
VVAIALISAKGSPGCTTTALALSSVWTEVLPGRRLLLAECDVAGGDVASGYLAGAADASRGVLGMAVTRCKDPLTAVWEQLVALDNAGNRLLLQGLTDPRQAATARTAWPQLAAAIPELVRQEPAVDIVMDLGRLHSQHEAQELWQVADQLILVTRSSLSSVAQTQAAVSELRDLDVSTRLTCLVVDEGRPYSGSEIAKALDLPVLATLPWDTRAANCFRGGGVSRSTSPLLRSCRSLVNRLASSVPEPFGASVSHV